MTRSRKMVWSAATAGVAMLLLLGYFYYGPETKPVPEPLPNPNGYDDFIAAGKLLQRGMNDPTLPGETGFNLDYARKYIVSNAPALDRLRAGLEKQSAVPVEFTKGWISLHLSHLASDKVLARTLSLAGYLQEHDGNYDTAMARSLEILNFGAATGRGGLVIDSLVAVAIENIAFNSLERQTPNLQPAECRTLINELENWKTNREPYAVTLAREKRWSIVYGRLEFNPLQRAVLRIREMIASKSLDPTAAALAKAASKHATVLHRGESFKVTVAARLFELEHKALPKTWSDVVPAYLPNVPINPETGRQLIYFN
jgi:hypothetical protein